MKLSATTIAHLNQIGKYADGNGLYLFVSKSKSKSWVYRYQVNQQRREMGLGKRRIGFIKSDIDEWLSQQRIELPVDTTPKVKVKSPQTVQDLEKIHRRNIKKLFNSQ